MLPIGHVLNDRYRIELLLGHGGMAAVYLVTHTRLHRRFALKIIAANLASQPHLLERFRQEIEILSELEHPHVVNIIDCDSYQGQFPYLVMELLKGQDLSRFLAKSGPLNPVQALSIFLQIASALNAAHGQNIVHRDLKPANIFLCEKGPFPNFIKVLDFGIAKVLQRDSAMQTHGSGVLGTPAYMAPEQALGQNHLIDARTDQFALASILYEMLAGRPAFHRPGEPALITLARVVQEPPPPLPDRELDAVLRRAWCKDPAGRFPTLQEFVEASGALDLTVAAPILSHQKGVPQDSTVADMATEVTPPELAARRALAAFYTDSSPSHLRGELQPSRWGRVALASLFGLLTILSLWIGARGKLRWSQRHRGDPSPTAATAIAATSQAAFRPGPGRQAPPIPMSEAILLPPYPAPRTVPSDSAPERRTLPISQGVNTNPPAFPRVSQSAPKSAPIKRQRSADSMAQVRPPRPVPSASAQSPNLIPIRVVGLPPDVGRQTERCVREAWARDLASRVGKPLLLSFRSIPMVKAEQSHPVDEYHRQVLNQCLRRLILSASAKPHSDEVRVLIGAEK